MGDKARSLAFEKRVIMANVLVKLFLGCQLLLRAKRRQAVAWFKKGYEVGQNQRIYVHNYIALRENNMPEKANIILKRGLNAFPITKRC